MATPRPVTVLPLFRLEAATCGFQLADLETSWRTVIHRATPLTCVASMFCSRKAIGSMFDALAKAANMDPIAFRLQNIDATQVNGVARWITVLQEVSKSANWKPQVAASSLKSGNTVTGRGVAMGGFAGSYPAVIADITVNKKTGKIAVNHLYAAQDAGTTVNPASVENQMVGCLVHGTSRALLEQVAFTKQRVTSLDWSTYQTLRFKDSPNVSVT